MYFTPNNSGRSARDRRRRGVGLIACAGVVLALLACGKTESRSSGAGAHPGDDVIKPGGNEPPGAIADSTPGDPNAASACANVDKSYAPKISAADFVANVDHPYFPLVAGASYKYAGDKRTSEVKVTPNTKAILGVQAIEVSEAITEGDAITRQTLDWYAQDKSGAVWRLGHLTKQMDGVNVVSTEGSWEAGKDGAQPGMVLPKEPAVGEQWRQGYYPCHVDDQVKLLADNASINTTGGSFNDCLQTQETSALDAKIDVQKYYCKDHGLVLRDDKAAGFREGLTEYEAPTGDDPFPPFPQPGGGVDFPDAGAIELPALPPLPQGGGN